MPSVVCTHPGPVKVTDIVCRSSSEWVYGIKMSALSRDLRQTMNEVTWPCNGLVVELVASSWPNAVKCSRISMSRAPDGDVIRSTESHRQNVIYSAVCVCLCYVRRPSWQESFFWVHRSFSFVSRLHCWEGRWDSFSPFSLSRSLSLSLFTTLSRQGAICVLVPESAIWRLYPGPALVNIRAARWVRTPPLNSPPAPSRTLLSTGWIGDRLEGDSRPHRVVPPPHWRRRAAIRMRWISRRARRWCRRAGGTGRINATTHAHRSIEHNAERLHCLATSSGAVLLPYCQM